MDRKLRKRLEKYKENKELEYQRFLEDKRYISYPIKPKKPPHACVTEMSWLKMQNAPRSSVDLDKSIFKGLFKKH